MSEGERSRGFFAILGGGSGVRHIGDEKVIVIEIEYMARDGNGAVYYMRREVETEDGIIELYAETPASDSYEAAYTFLREEILEQAVEAGVDVDSLAFYYD